MISVLLSFVLAGAGLGISYVPSVSLIGVYFHKKRTIALGLAASGNAMGVSVFPPLLRCLIDYYGWRWALMLTGAICLNLLVVAALLRPLTIKHDKMDSKAPSKVFSKGFNLLILKNISFLAFCMNTICISIGISVVMVHLSAYAKVELGLNDCQGALLFTTLGVGNFAGRIAFGFLGTCRCLKPLLLYPLSFLVAGIATLMCPLARNYASLLTYSGTVGFLIGSLGPLSPQILVELFGVSMLNSAYGYLLFFAALGSLLGGTLAGKKTLIYHIQTMEIIFSLIIDRNFCWDLYQPLGIEIDA